MQRSLCNDCELKNADKRNSSCESCVVRHDYADRIGDPAISLPIEMTDMGLKMKPKTFKYWTTEDVEFIKENINTMTNKQLAEYLGRTKSAVDNQLVKMKIKRNGNFKRGVVDSEYTSSSPDPLPADDNSKDFSVPLEQSKDFFILDFSECGQLYDRFLDYSKLKFRKPENQILYLISKELNREPG